MKFFYLIFLIYCVCGCHGSTSFSCSYMFPKIVFNRVIYINESKTQIKINASVQPILFISPAGFTSWTFRKYYDLKTPLVKYNYYNLTSRDVEFATTINKIKMLHGPRLNPSIYILTFDWENLTANLEIENAEYYELAAGRYDIIIISDDS